VTLTGDLEIENKSSAPIASLFVNLPEQAKVNLLTFGRGEKLVSTDPLGTRIYELVQPLGVSERTKLHFDIAFDNRGFTNDAGDLHIAENGTFFDSSHYLPSLGYSDEGELTDDKSRRKHGLAEKQRMRDLDDPVGLANNYISRDADWIKLNATISTSPDQIAIAPGYLTREWSEGGRRHFRYEMDAGILNFYSFISARYAVKRDIWRDPKSGSDVALEVFYHPAHDYNVERMIRAMQASLEYFTREFWSVSAPTSTGHRVPALRAFRAVLSKYDPVFGGGWIHRARRRLEGRRDRLPLLRHVARDRPPVVGASGHRRRGARLDDALRVVCPVLGIDGDEAHLWRARDAKVSPLRARFLPARARKRTQDGAPDHARRESALCPLREGHTRHVCAAGCDR